MSTLVKSTELPLKDGQVINSIRHGKETVGGEITPLHSEPVCWTLQGNWYRRRDGEEMTGASGEVTTTKKFWRLCAEGKFK